MALTLLQLVGRAYTEMGLGAAPGTVIGNTALAVVQFLNLANGLGNDLVRELDWQAIKKEYRFTTVYYEYTGTTTEDSTTLSALSSTTGLTTNPTYFSVLGTGINMDTQLVSVNGGAATAVISQAATATGTVTLTFAQTFYAMPSDYDRLVNDTEWDKTQRWQILGPQSSQEWQFLKSGDIATGPRERFRIFGDFFNVWPPLSSNRFFGFEYVRNQWVKVASAADTSKSSFTVDTDTCIYADQVMVESLKLRMSKAGGFPHILAGYSPRDIQSGFANRQLDQAKANDAAARILSLSRRPAGLLISQDNVQDGYFNV